ncbi:MAG: non-canonical purine NTP pyrophosphatase [Candidatus Diapherotrites archaeon]|uniref:Non-canonical purine NTP pyrophosphatase n=1 Tax=Candidatus Iainarchaeum sp. TaxID=3101447 RepID=A0A8T4LBZ6_9ARCH|nr:non-canonical purine NTP pyrophosphatase [Candidatus Diapherotrites archaeon]
MVLSILFVSGNEYKFHEVASVLAPEIVVSLADCDFFEDSEQSIEVIAKEKARQAFEKFKCPLIVEDTGVFFEAFPNFPGAMAKRIYNAIGQEGLLKLVEGKSRRAFFETVLVFTDGKKTKVFSGKSFGSLLDKPAGPHERFKLGYERLIVPDGFSKPLSSFSMEEKNSISHRAKAVNGFKKWFLDR